MCLFSDGNAENVPFGALNYSLPVEEAVARLAAGDLHVSPSGAVFVKSGVRRGLMPIMLEEILNTRFMVKKAMKAYKGNPVGGNCRDRPRPVELEG